MATSCEPSRSSAYSEDLRWRIVWQGEALNCKPSMIAKNLSIDESTVRRVFNTSSLQLGMSLRNDTRLREHLG